MDKTMGKIVSLLTAIYFLSTSLVACETRKRIDLKTLNTNPEKYVGKRVIVTTDLQSINDAPEAYIGKEVELFGNVSSTCFGVNNEWSFILKDNLKNRVKCYIGQYNQLDLNYHEMALENAVEKNEPITIVGRFKKQRIIALEWFEIDSVVYAPRVITYNWY